MLSLMCLTPVEGSGKLGSVGTTDWRVHMRPFQYGRLWGVIQAKNVLKGLGRRCETSFDIL